MSRSLITLRIDARSRRVLDCLRCSLGVQSDAELFRLAVALLHAAVKTVEEGGAVLLIGPDRKAREIVLR